MIMLQYAEIFLKPTIIILGIISIVYTTGVVWRVERKLDISYKFFLIAIVSFVIGQFLELFSFDKRESISILTTTMRFVFSVFFLAGIWTMRDLVRNLDGEKK